MVIAIGTLQVSPLSSAIRTDKIANEQDNTFLCRVEIVAHRTLVARELIAAVSLNVVQTSPPSAIKDRDRMPNGASFVALGIN
jgi:hypothetical protein